MNHSTQYVAVSYALAVAACLVCGPLLPPNFSWGFHFFAFLPTAVIVGYFVILTFLVFSISLGYSDPLIGRLASFLASRPMLFLVSTVLLFFCIALILHVRIPLLGDSFVIINNYENTFRGTHDLRLTREPFAMIYFYGIMKVLGTTKYPEMMNAFMIGEMILGSGFIVFAFGTVRALFEDVKVQLLAFFFLLSIPYMQVFFGYAEIYSVELFFLSLFVYLGVLVLRKGVPFYVLPPVYIIMVYTHYLTLICSLSLLYAAVRTYRSGGLKNLLMGALCGAAVMLVIFMSVDFRLSVLLPVQPHTHFLSLQNTADEYQTYGLFSFLHGVDLSNMLILMAPWILVLVGWSGTRRPLAGSETTRFLLLSIVPFFLFLILAKFDLGMAKDWDVSSPYFFLIACYSIIVFVQSRETPDVRFLAVILAVTVLTSGVYFTVNASRSPSIARARALLDKRNLPRGGYFQSVFHLSMYYLTVRDIESMGEVWENFVMNFPEDPRGYQKKAKALWELGEPGFDRVSTVFERWLKSGSDTSEAKKEYAAFCFNAGTVYYSSLEWDKAQEMFERTIRLDPGVIPAYNNIGLVFARRGDFDQAITWYRRVIGMDSGYAQPYRNIGRALTQKGDLSGAIGWFKKAIEKDPKLLDAYEDLAGIYYSKKEYDASFAVLKQAARLGSITAQKILRSNSLSW